MSECRFSIQLSSSPEQTLSRAEAAIRKQGGEFSGTPTGGSFSIPIMVGQVRGSYTIIGDQLEVVITDKPMFVGCGMIEAQLRKQLG